MKYNGINSPPSRTLMVPLKAAIPPSGKFVGAGIAWGEDKVDRN